MRLLWRMSTLTRMMKTSCKENAKNRFNVFITGYTQFAYERTVDKEKPNFQFKVIIPKLPVLSYVLSAALELLELLFLF